MECLWFYIASWSSICFIQHHSASLTYVPSVPLLGIIWGKLWLILVLLRTPCWILGITPSPFLVELPFLAVSKDNHWIITLLTEFGNDNKVVLDVYSMKSYCRFSLKMPRWQSYWSHWWHFCWIGQIPIILFWWIACNDMDGKDGIDHSRVYSPLASYGELTGHLDTA